MPTVDAGRGPVTLRLPASYDNASTGYPLVVLLPGWGSGDMYPGMADAQGLRSEVDAQQIIQLDALGRYDADGKHYCARLRLDPAGYTSHSHPCSP